MFVKDALEKEVGIVVELCGAVWRNFQPRECEILQGKCYSQWARAEHKMSTTTKIK